MADRILQAYEFHPLANIFPLIEGQAYQDLMADILKYGVREPIWLYEGKILDGRNRYRAATAMRVEFETSEYTGDNPVAFVVSLNLHRRHLNESQRGMVAAKLETLKQGRPNKDANLHDLQVSRSDAADMPWVTKPLPKSFQITACWPESICWCNRANDSVNRACWGFATGCKTTPKPFLMKSAPGLMNALTQCLSRTASPPSPQVPQK